MRIVAVFHGTKLEGLAGTPNKVGANPPLSLTGMQKVLNLVPTIKDQGPFETMYCSRMSRALDTASIIALEFDLDIRTKKELGQYGNRDEERDIYYPGHETDGFVTWQNDGVSAFLKIAKEHSDTTVLVISHRPVIGGIVAHCMGVDDEAGIIKVISDPTLAAKGFRVFEITDDNIKIVD